MVIYLSNEDAEKLIQAKPIKISRSIKVKELSQEERDKLYMNVVERLKEILNGERSVGNG